MNEAYNVLLDALTGERLDMIVTRTPEYRHVQDDYFQAVKTFEKQLTAEQSDQFEHVKDKYEAVTMCYVKTAYRQAVYDMINILESVHKDQNQRVNRNVE